MNAGNVPEASGALVDQMADRLLASPRRERVLLLWARPQWDGPDVLHRGEHEVHVVRGVSQLAILEAVAHLPGDARAVVLTDRTPDDLGDAILTGIYAQNLQFAEEWELVPSLFGARDVAQDLRSHSWAARALLDHVPPGGWETSEGFTVSARHALGGLLAHLIGLERGTIPDADTLLAGLAEPEQRAAWQSVDDELAARLAQWAHRDLGAAAAFTLHVARQKNYLTPLALALTAGVLWPADDEAPVTAQVEARVRLEKYLGGFEPRPADLRAVAQLADAAVLRVDNDPRPDPKDVQAVTTAATQASTLLDELGWADGARRSTILPEGLDARMQALATAVAAGDGYEERLDDLLAHRQADQVREVALMAVRLARWLATNEEPTDHLAVDLEQHTTDGAWVDVAVGAVWNASDDPVTSGALATLVERVRARRSRRDERAARRLSEVTAWTPQAGWSGAHGVEDVLRGVVQPWRAVRGTGGVLLVVLDGMSMAIAHDLAEEATRQGLVEWAPETLGRRLAVVAALPSETAVSRTSLLTGEVCHGSSATEKRGLAAAFAGTPLFHKGDLRSGAGAALPDAVASALADAGAAVVGVVINTIDDATHKTDTSARRWDLDALAPLRALLAAARTHRRTVVLTSDHGHVVERETRQLPSAARDGRWRAAGGPVSDGEVAVSGPRVQADGRQEAVLLWGDDTRYGHVAAGYHGGASLAEVTVPVVVLQPATATSGADGWAPVPEQQPVWWNEPVSAAAVHAPVTLPSGRRKKAAPPAGGELLFDLPKGDAAAVAEPSDLVARVLASAVYAEQRHTVRSASDVTDEQVAHVLDELVSRHGTAHLRTLARALGVPASKTPPVLIGVRRLLNVDGAEVVTAPGSGMVRLHVDNLREVFEVDG